MLKTLRQEQILEKLEEKQSLSVADLASLLDCSMMTIRRDLDYLERQGSIQKVHGGAILKKNESDQTSFSERIVENMGEKIRIAKAAGKLITEGSIVFFDSGTTTMNVVKYAPQHIAFTAITNNLITATELCNKPKINVIMIGGEIHKATYSAVNTIATEQAARFNADLVFLSTKGVSIPEGLFEPLLPLIEIKKSMVSNSRKIVLLADNSKFKNKSLCLSIPLSDIDEIITDNQTPSETIDQIRSRGINVTVV